MQEIAEATLSAREREAVEFFVESLRRELGDELIAVWLYGSRARGETPHPESDIDLMVITRGGNRDLRRVTRIATRVELSVPGRVDLAAHVWDPKHLEQRRSIESFFVQEVDRDKIVLYGEP